MPDQTTAKLRAANAALQYIPENSILGVGTGSTVNIFIKLLAQANLNISAIASSQATAKLLNKLQIPIVTLNEVNTVPIYIDGADAYNKFNQLVKGGGGALTQEKIIASAAEKFICITDSSKNFEQLGKCAIPIEVIPMARSFVAREICKLGGSPQYRTNFITDNQNIILDVINLQINQPIALEQSLNNIPGVVENGIFAKRTADVLLIGDLL